MPNLTEDQIKTIQDFMKQLAQNPVPKTSNKGFSTADFGNHCPTCGQRVIFVLNDSPQPEPSKV
jgi:hypothetical protein